MTASPPLGHTTRIAGSLLGTAVLATVAACVPVPQPPADPDPPAPSAHPVPTVTGRYDGWYRCRGDRTGLTLTIEADDRRPGGLTAQFRFYPIPENPNAGAGEFAMVGEQADGQVALRPDSWVEQPGGYIMLGLTADVPAGEHPQVLTGSTNGSGSCHGFELTRTVVPAGRDERIAGTWEGYYRCRGDRRGLRLVVTPAEQGRFRATAAFYPLPGQPSVESGSFAMNGYLSPLGMVARPDYWIERPGGYIMLGLSAPVSGTEPVRLEGRTDGGSCDRFALDKVSGRWSDPPV
jgi:hypothetical protein